MLNNYEQYINDVTDGEIFEIYAGIAKMWTDIHRLMWAKIEEAKTGSWFGTPISVHILAILAQISHISLSVASLICYP